MSGQRKKEPRLQSDTLLRAKRLQRLQRLLDAPLIITKPEHLFWLSGFTGTSGAVCLCRAGAYFITDPRYTEQALHEVIPEITRVAEMDRLEQIVARRGFLKGEAQVYLEEETVYAADIKRWQAALPDIAVLTKESPLHTLRLIKEAEEVAAIRAALRLTEEAMAWIAPYIRPGVREIELAARLEFYARMKGASRAAFNLIVASGANTAKPHGVATTRAVRENEPVQFDIGWVCAGYCSDFSRVAFCGSKPPAALRRMHALVGQALAIGKNAVRAGEPFARPDRDVRAFFKREGVVKQYLHSLGHGLGLEIHEAPRLSHKAEGKLLPGMVLTVEPGLYRAGKYGVRLEDVLLVTPSGNEVLTDFPHALACIPANRL
jgi:Xaa-Pro aminopeptidase